MPLRGAVVLPQGEAELEVARPASRAALLAALQHPSRELVVVAQRDADRLEPDLAGLYEVGTLVSVVQVTRLADGTRRVRLEARSRVRLLEVTERAGTLHAFAVACDESAPDDPLAVAGRVRSLHDQVDALARAGVVPGELAARAAATQVPGRLADLVARALGLPWPVQQEILAMLDVDARASRVATLAEEAFVAASLARRERARGSARRRDALSEDVADLLDAAERAELPVDVRARVVRELGRLRGPSTNTAEAGVTRAWAETLLAMPWGIRAEDHVDLAAARRLLDAEHEGLRAVKARILEHLAVWKLRGDVRGAVLCLVGPPGVGKTTLAEGIARATRRPFVRVALGGVRDEAEIRGHRRTYVGAMPGRIAAGLRRAGVTNPVFLLDEVDKLTSDGRGDPASALLEVLDPAQNHAFADHYLDTDLDLSQVLFVCTANSTASIPPALLDRMEVVRIGGYTEREKRAIAARHLLPARMAAAGLPLDHARLTRAALEHLIRGYTREAGVRGLDRELGAVCRKLARRHVERDDVSPGSERVSGAPRADRRAPLTVGVRQLERLLGPPRHRAGQVGLQDEAGFVNGLAWTSAGGVMVPIEAIVVRGNGKTTMTGQLGSVFRESCEAAFSYIRSRARDLGLDDDAWQRVDVHVHVPELWGVDGPSAGVTLTTAIVSAVCRIPVRAEVAMTGEVTLRGKVRPIGGLKEKLLAAVQAGAAVVVVPRDNATDLKEVPRSVRRALDIRLVDHIDEVLAIALAVDDAAAMFRARMDALDAVALGVPPS